MAEEAEDVNNSSEDSRKESYEILESWQETAGHDADKDKAAEEGGWSAPILSLARKASESLTSVSGNALWSAAAVSVGLSGKQQPATSENNPPKKAVKDHMAVERSNLLNMMQLSVKVLIQSAVSLGRSLDSHSPPLQQFLVVLEHCLKHALKALGVETHSSLLRFNQYDPTFKHACISVLGATKAIKKDNRTAKKSFIGQNKSFWAPLELVEKLCPESADIAASARDLPGLKTCVGRARAWLHLALMQKKMADYMKALIERKDLLSEFYEPGALMLEEEGAVVVGLLVGLNVIDANLCLKGEDLDSQVGVIDFSLYFKDPQSNESHKDCTVTDLQAKLDSLEKANSKLIEEMAAATDRIQALEEEQEQLREENSSIKQSSERRVEVTKQDSEVELETYRQSRQGLDEMYNEVWKQYKEEKRIHQELQKELELQVGMKQEMELAMKLLAKDTHDKQDTLVALRQQLDEVKTINLQMFNKAQVTKQDSEVELETYRQSRQGLDEMYNEVWKQYKEEKRIHQELQKELELQVGMKQEMELAMKLLAKDTHDKQDTLVALRQQLDEVKTINLQMFNKAQSAESLVQQKNEIITQLEEKINQMGSAMKQMDERMQSSEQGRKEASEKDQDMKQELTGKVEALQRQLTDLDKHCVSRSVPALRRSRSGAFGVSAPALGAALLRFVQRFCAWCLVLCTWDSVLDAPRRSTLGARTSTLDASALRRSVHIHRRSALDAWCLDASTLGARTSTLDASALDAWRIDASTLGARTSTLDASALDAWRIDASTLGARTSTLDASALDAWRIDASTLGARTSTLDASALDAWRIDASTLGARTSTLDASALRRSVHIHRRSALDAWCLDASTLGARTSTLDASALDAWRIDASTLGARTSTLDASALDAWRIDASTLGARTSTLDASALDAWRIDASTLGARTSTLDASALDAWRIDASTLGARTSTLDASALRRSVHAPRRSTLRRFDARCTYIDARRSTLGASTPRRSVHAPRRSTLRRFDARCTHLDARRFGASTLGARTSTLDASALRRSVHAPRRSTLRRFDARCTHLDARRFGASTLGARTSTLDASALDAWRIDASTLGARTSTLDASALRRSVHAPRRSTLRRFDARCTHLDARRFGASTLGARTSTLDASALRRSVHAPRRSTLRRFDARCTHLDARRFGARRLAHRRLDARCTHLDARRFGASTLGARTSTLDASALRRSVYAPRRFGARRSAPQRSVYAPRCLGSIDA
ncbi:UNVERIFIED_CONTAM: hypothetical protein FKN15_007179 [Acipenser sinensis]